ncbi:hypothetical protein TRVA0_077S00254 [Trichomonascus vanleenenianus]|uniref:uncharacterized protein n=1 Tax=Trichomonascus vanleenenianus TaxID=2268995 RepID=UPI003EC96C21
MPMPVPMPVHLAMPMPFVPMGYYYSQPAFGQQQLMYQNPLATAMATRYFYNSLLHTAVYPSRYESDSPSSATNSSDNNAVIPRGPPKKPPQSNYAIWVGNLHPETSILDMCHAFGTNDIQSIFLIRQTKCAFVNYSSEEAVQLGMDRFQERFNGLLRGNQLCVKRQIVNSEDDDETTTPSADNSAEKVNENGDRYFVCKSLTVADLDVARRLEVWVTQPKNEDKFNEAFRTSPNVYLFFSANRTGEFFGVARMESEITYQQRPSELAANHLPPPTPSPDTGSSPPLCIPSSDPSVPGLGIIAHRPIEITPTAADPSVPIPSGRIVDDAARGNLFWERWSDDNDSNEPNDTTNHPSNDDHDAYDHESSSAEDKIKTFKIKWVSFTRVPFFLTNGIHNRLNKNKPVKIGRDGTEIDRETGERLLSLFNLD